MFEEQQNTEKINDNVNEEEILLDDLNGPNSGDDIEDIFAGTDNENLFDANESVSSAFSNEEEIGNPNKKKLLMVFLICLVVIFISIVAFITLKKVKE